MANVAIVGRPNVGKSALFNRLVGRKIAIVHDQPGITRDRISTICTRGARAFTLWDTGGLAVPQSRDELSAQVRRAAEEALHDSDLLLFVVDAKEGLSPIDEDLARMLRKSQMPGTTRDAVDILYERHGRKFVFIDTAGIRRRGKRSTSVEVFSVMRAERSIRRAELCVLIVDLTMGVTAQDKRIAGLIQKAQKPAIIVLNKWDLVRLATGRVRLIGGPRRGEKQVARQLVEQTRARIFFLEYAPVLITSALSGENVEKLFVSIEKVQRAARQHIGTGILNRLLRQAFEGNPPPLVKGRRLKLFYAAQTRGKEERQLQSAEFVLFVNDPRLMNETYRRYLEARIRKAEPYPGLPITLTLRPRTGSRHKKQSGRRAGQANKQQAVS